MAIINAMRVSLLLAIKNKNLLFNLLNQKIILQPSKILLRKRSHRKACILLTGRHIKQKIVVEVWFPQRVFLQLRNRLWRKSRVTSKQIPRATSQ